MSRRKTKIVCTIGPATDSEETLAAMIRAGMDVARLNFSHGDHESHRRAIRIIRRLSQAAGRPVGILQDLCGPKIRIGRMEEGELDLEAGEKVVLGPEAGEGIIPVLYPYLAEDVALGEQILLSDGLVEVKVEAREERALVCRVVVGGSISSGKGVNLPSSNLRIQAFTGKDKADLAVGLEEGVDFVAMSFVRKVEDLAPLQAILARVPSRPLLIAKLEKPEAIERLEEILGAVDGVMVARGDLGVEMPFEEVPLIQKRIIDLARQAGKPVITATQMLRTMIDSPRPSRAEATDVANAVLDGTDALMLSDETAVGHYPIQAIAVLDRLARTTEPLLASLDFVSRSPAGKLPPTETAISRAATGLARDLDAAAIIASTTSGSTPRLVARFRPDCPIIGFTPEEKTLHQLTLSWGVIPAKAANFNDTDRMLEMAGAWVTSQGLAGPGGRLVVMAGLPFGVPGTTNMIKVMDMD